MHKFWPVMVNELGIPEVDAGLLVKIPQKCAEYLDKASEGVANPKVSCKLHNGPNLTDRVGRTKPRVKEAFDLSALTPEYLRDLVLLLDSGQNKNESY